jgi:mono/diheme cytochrome c family protein
VRHLRKNIVPRGALLLLLCAGTGAGVHADDSDSLFTSSAGIGNYNGQQIYEHICTGCHMSGGQGAVGAGFYPKLSGDKKLISWEYAALTVLNGRNGMPAFGLPPAVAQQTRAVQLSDAQVAEVVNYVRSHFDNKFKSAVTAKDVAALPHPASIAMPF